MAGSAETNLFGLNAEELARRAQEGNSEAFVVLAKRYAPALGQYLHRRCGSVHDADDLCQETLLRAWQNLRTYDPTRPFAPWLFAVARNHASSRLGKRPPERTATAAPERIGESPPAEIRALEREREEGVWASARQSLGERQYAALWLRYGCGMSVREIAREMNLTRTHVKVTLFRARRKLLHSPVFEQWR